VCLVIISGLDSVVEATRKLKSASRVDVSIEIVKNSLRETDLESIKKVSNPALYAKNVKEMLEFAKMHKDWTMRDWEWVIFIDERRINQ
jgi:transposase